MKKKVASYVFCFLGNFPCSVCGKVFCHSSSLSRHRMQAHFKSYTCTQCNQEISSNETLRSHMFRVHSISRMFMCRCCNWAFPDKTSLHIHMQSMIKSGTPGDVSVLARSSTEGPGMAGAVGEMSPHELDVSPSSSPQEGRDSLSPMNETPVKIPPFNNSLLNGSIFPALANADFFTKLRAKSDALLPQAGSEAGALLAQWLANNPYASQFAGQFHAAQMMYAATNGDSLNLQNESSDRQSFGGLKMDISDIKKEDDINGSFNISNVTENNGTAQNSITDVNKLLGFIQETKPSSAGSSLDKLLEKKVAQSSRNKRKASKPQQLPSFLKVASEDDGEREFMGTPPKVSAENGLEKTEDHVCPSGEQPSPAVSDSHTSGSSSAPSGLDVSSPQKCYDCQMMKAKLGMSESRIQYLESKVNGYEAKVNRLENHITEAQSTIQQYEKDQADLRNRVENFEKKFLECQEHVVSLMGSLRDGPESFPTVMGMMETLLKCTMFRNEEQS
ncbi:unnamed protein product [Enterobius vermicularis]|uniref:C2H2-type domain-containing protein n=1 Tax=Enterobius vermicularis TaxID=51028 RepID=A0A158QA95_ENTVE|nr:unnamed protein product [Enterobius vermicularis]